MSQGFERCSQYVVNSTFCVIFTHPPPGRRQPVRDNQLSISDQLSCQKADVTGTLTILPESHEKNGRITDIPSLIGDPTSRRFASDDVLFFAKISEDVSFSPETNIFTENQTSNRLVFR